MKNIKCILAAVAMSIASLTAWAGDFNGTNYNQKITLPSAVDLSYGTYTGFNRNAFFSDANKIEYSQKDAAAKFTFTVSEASSFLFSLQASNGNGNGDYPCDLKVKIWADGGSEPSEPNVTFTVADDNDWNNFVSYAYATSELAAGDYYLKIIWTDQANVQNIKFSPIYAPSTTVLPLTSTDNMTAHQYGHPNNDKNQAQLGYMDNNDYIEFAINHAETADMLVNFTASVATDGATIVVSLTNVSTSEVTTKTVNIANNGFSTYSFYNALFPELAAGTYLLRMTFTVPSSYAPNFTKLKVMTPDHGIITPSSSAFPITNTDAMTAYKFGSNDEKNIEDHLASMKQDDYIEYPVYFNSARDYLVSFKTSTNADNQNIQVTLTNLSTSEATNKEVNIRNTGNYNSYDYNLVIFPSIEEGTYLLRFAFPTVNGSNYAPNFGDLKLQNPETAYDALPLTGYAVLDLSKWPTSGDPRYQSDHQNLGFIYHNNTAYFYVYNTNHTAHYTLSAGIHTNVSDANLVVTITDVATGSAEVNEEAFDVAEGSSSYPIQTFALSGAITPGLKLITFKFTKDDEAGQPWLYNIKDISFSMSRYTRTHPHMNLNTLCYPYQIDYYTGATFYTMLNKVMDGETVTDVYLQEHIGPLEAGTPYFYEPEDGAAELVCYYSGDRAETPQKVNGVQGSYDDNAPVPSGSFVTYNNMLRIVSGAFVTLGEYRAYVDMESVPADGSVRRIAGRRLLKMRNADAPAVATGIGNVQSDKGQWTKVIENGVLYLKYKGTKYDVQGMRVK